MTPRHRHLLDHIRQHGDTSVDELARLLGVTTQTIRRDIRELEDARLLARYHGGVGIPSTVQNIDYDQRREMDSEAKCRIAQLAAARVENGRSLIINIGTTSEEVAKALRQHRGLRVITNNLNVATILSNNDDTEIIIAGGLVRNRDRGVIGEATIDFMRQFKVDIGIIGVSGIEHDGTLLDYDYREVRVTQAIMEQSREVWLVADHTKFGRHAMVRLGSVAQIDKFFTDLPLPPEAAEAFDKAGVEVIVASQPAT
ncbi:DeoR family transcriptional regulator [Duganella sp. FT92W]|uniref:DeoR family transcriptional regulator n=1 Tax=Pseudoduganella rivuli TaxID=2666085 RepID=A0A7X2LUY4_9BURK|nr:DeoR/GlpR family DNA-binding transcription regulator [Pseudoduganella rivuli]MRV76155.1 DeoR family transcriptional regulator [Pseudoduganella rivuli]